MLRQTEIDGVPTLIAPTSGPMTAGLTFRVGRSDETLATSGITHLVEHLALHRHGLAEYHYNGASSSTYTTFQAQGSEADIVSYLTGVCESLADMPMHRLETEKEILRTEAAGRGKGVNHQMPLWRYGAQNHGLVSYPEWGLIRLRPEDLEYWVHTWFTKHNAVLWIAGNDIPSGLRLKLRDGQRRAVVAPTSILPTTPAYFAGEAGKIVLDMIAPRATVTQVFSMVLERELFRSLRQEGGYSYTASTGYDARGDGSAIVTAFADALPDKQDAALGAFIDVLAKVRAGRIERSDLDFVRAKTEESFRHPDIHAARLGTASINLLVGQPNPTLDQVWQEVNAVGPNEIQAIATEALSTALLQVPQGHNAEWAGFAAAPTHSAEKVTGDAYRNLQHDAVQLVLGPDGVSGVTPSQQVTVRFRECAVVLAWPDGARRLVGTDGITVHIEPTMYEKGREVISRIDAAAPPAAVVWLPARDPQQIPRAEYRKVRQGFATRRIRIESVIVMLLTLALVGVFAASQGGLMMISLLLVVLGLARMLWLWVKVFRKTEATVGQ